MGKETSEGDKHGRNYNLCNTVNKTDLIQIIWVEVTSINNTLYHKYSWLIGAHTIRIV